MLQSQTNKDCSDKQGKLPKLEPIVVRNRSGKDIVIDPEKHKELYIVLQTARANGYWVETETHKGVVDFKTGRGGTDEGVVYVRTLRNKKAGDKEDNKKTCLLLIRCGRNAEEALFVLPTIQKIIGFLKEENIDINK